MGIRTNSDGNDHIYTIVTTDENGLESAVSIAAEAHIRDEGIDIEKTNDVNWNQQISGVNGSIIRTLGNQPETFNFDNIQFTEEIVSLFETGDDLIVQNGAGRFLTPFVSY